MNLLSAYILHTRPWRDTSLLLDVLSPEQGRIRAVARGQRNQSGRHKGSVCQPFRPLAVALVGKSELKTISRIEADGPPRLLPGKHLYAGFYANEILLRALPEADPHPRLYQAYDALLATLACADADIEPPLRQFEMILLDELGYGIDFSHDAASGLELQPDGRYAFVAEQGFVALGAGRIAQSRAVYRGRDVLALARGQFTEGHSRDVAKRVMRQALQALVGDKPLQSRMLYRPAESAGKEG